MVPPRKTIGIVPIKIDRNNFSWNKLSRKLFKDRFLNLKISILKYQTNAKTLPIWIIADNEEPGSSIPKKRDMTFKWAVLLTGINSVRPWIKPYIINFKYSKTNKISYVINSNLEKTIYIYRVKANIN